MGKSLSRWSFEHALSYLTSRYPVDLALMGESGARAFAVYSARRMAELGLPPRAGGLRYLDLLVLLGIGFDDDPQLDWAWRVLVDERRNEEGMGELWLRAISYIKEIAGTDGRLYRRALLRAQRLPPSALVGRSWSEPSDGAQLLKSLYPEKFATFEHTQQAVFDAALSRCRAHDEKEKGVVPLYQVLMLLLGSHFEDDPRYAWAVAALDEGVSWSREPYQHLHKAATAALERALVLIRKEA